jgi:Protein of unknown function (DUF4019)
MKSLVFTGALTLAIGMVSAAAAVTLELSSGTMNEINLTTDSSQGWIPTAEQRQRVLKTVEVFLDAVEGGRYAEAYELQTEINKHNRTLAQFTQDAQKFRALAGPVKFWRVLKVTWTKDPAHAPFPGIYAAIDLAGQFANVDRDCGYMVLYQQPASGDFTVMRRENNYLDNATARNIEEKQSKAEVAKVWGQLSRYCPNYVSSLDAR